MTNSKLDAWKRKIANGKRRQADVIMQKKLVAWDKLKHVDKEWTWGRPWMSSGLYRGGHQ